MRIIHALIIGGIACVTAGHGAAAQDDSRIDAIVSPVIAADAPGCAVGASLGGRTLFARGYGLANLEHVAPITASTRFEIGSVTKQFTAAALLLLVQDGKLSLDDPASRFITELPDYGHPLTVDHLITHLSGLRDIDNIRYMQGWFPFERRQQTRAEAIGDVTRQSALNFRPGSEWSYTNSGFLLAGEIVQRVSGQSLGAFMRERLFTPLGMDSTDLRENALQVFKDRAAQYASDETGFLQYPPNGVAGAGGVVTNVPDLLIWNAALDSGKLGPLVTTKLQEEARTDSGRLVGYARGLEIGSRNGVREISHGGVASGVSAYLARFPEQKLSVAVLCNGDGVAPMIGGQIADLYLPAAPASVEPQPAPASAVALSPGRIETLAGYYRDEVEGLPVRLRVDGTALKWGRSTLVPRSDTDFDLRGVDLRFASDDRFMLTYDTGRTLAFNRVPGPPPVGAALNDYAGAFHSADVRTTYRVVPEGDGLKISVVDGPTFELTLKPIGKDTFETDGDVLVFGRDSAGRINRFLFTVARVSNVEFLKVS